MADIFKWFDRLLTFITNNKLVSLMFPLVVFGGAYSSYEGFNLKERVEALEKKEHVIQLPEKTIIRETVTESSKELDDIKSRINHYHPE